MPSTDDLVPAQLLERLGIELWGEARWQELLAARLGVRTRAIQNWRSGRNTIPEGVWRELAEMFAADALKYQAAAAAIGELLQRAEEVE